MSTFGTADEATYYTLLLMPPNGNITQPFAYTPTEIFAFWEANHVSNPTLAAHSNVELTQALVDAAIAHGAARALYWIVFADGDNSRYMINHLLKQIPVQSLRFLRAIGVFDAQIAAARAVCRVEVTPYAPSPAIPSSVQPPTNPENFSLAIQIPVTGISGGCAVTNVATATDALNVLRLSSDLTQPACDVIEF
jgi:hypothetical protein